MTVPLSSPLRFGWFEATHRAINLGAIRQLPESKPQEARWKQFLTDNFTRIMTADSLRDAQYEGPAHFMDVSERGNTTASGRNLYTVPGYQLWQEAKKAFTKKRLTTVGEELKANPLKPGSPSDPPSLFQDIQEAYTLVKKELDRYAQGLPRLQILLNGDPAHDQPLIQAAKEDLLDNLGWLTHMVGDSSMPLHTASANGDWPLEPHPKMGNLKFENGIHKFIEGNLFSDAEHQAMIEAAQKAPALNSSFLNQDDLFQQVLAQQLIDSYMLNRDILQAHQAALDTEKATVDQPALQESLKGVLLPHIRKAQTNLAWVLHSIWKQAGEPGFDPPEPPQPKGNS